MSGKRMFITGGGSGIGQATAIHYARKGYRVAILDASESGVEATGKLIAGEGAQWMPFVVDVRNRDAIRAAMASVNEAWGGLDILLCAAGILRSGRLADPTTEIWDLTMDINVKGVMLTIQEALPLLRRTCEAPRRKIAVISSATAMNPKVGIGAYAISKLALVNLVRVLAAEIAAEGININGLAPGTIETPMVSGLLSGAADGSGFKVYGAAPVGRLGQTSDIVDAVDFLCGDRSDFVTGAILPVDGGTTATFPVS